MNLEDPNAEKLFKLFVIAICAFMHYVLTMLIFFIPIDVAHYMFGIPQFFAIGIGAFALVCWSMATAVAVYRAFDKGEE